MIVVARAIICAAALLCAVLVCSALAPLPAAAQPVLRVGTYLDNKPWQFRDGSGHSVGFEVDLIEAIGARLGRKVMQREMVFGDLFTSLEDGSIDVAMSSISITPPRVERFDFTQPYYRTTQGLVVMLRAPIRALADLKGRTVSVIARTTSDQWVEANREVYGIAAVQKVQGLDEALEKLTEGSVDAHFGDMPALIYRLLGRSDLAVVARLPTDELYGLMLAKQSPLTAQIDGAITQLKQDGTLARIHQKWFGALPDPGSPVAKVMPRP